MQTPALEKKAPVNEAESVPAVEKRTLKWLFGCGHYKRNSDLEKRTLRLHGCGKSCGCGVYKREDGSLYRRTLFFKHGLYGGYKGGSCACGGGYKGGRGKGY